MITSTLQDVIWLSVELSLLSQFPLQSSLLTLVVCDHKGVYLCVYTICFIAL